MIHGIDTDFLVAVEIREHPFHVAAEALLRSLLADGHEFALAPQTLGEFIHVVTDVKRMPQPLSMTEAIRRAEHWWQAAEVVRVFPNDQTVVDYLDWLARNALGRKRLLDTMLAATFVNAGVRRVITNNSSDFRVFRNLELVNFQS